MKGENAVIRGKRLHPLGWRIRAVLSPLWSFGGWRWWSVLACDEGLALVPWPFKKWLSVVLRVGIRAGVAHMPTTISSDEWPLSEAHRHDFEVAGVQAIPRALLSRIEVTNERWLWRHIRIRDSGSGETTLTLVDPRSAVEYRARLTEVFPDVVQSTVYG